MQLFAKDQFHEQLQKYRKRSNHKGSSRFCQIEKRKTGRAYSNFESKYARSYEIFSKVLTGYIAQPDHTHSIPTPGAWRAIGCAKESPVAIPNFLPKPKC